MIALTRDEVVEGRGKIRVVHFSGVAGVLVGYSFDRDVVTVAADWPGTTMSAPRSTWSRPTR